VTLPGILSSGEGTRPLPKLHNLRSRRGYRQDFASCTGFIPLSLLLGKVIFHTQIAVPDIFNRLPQLHIGASRPECPGGIADTTLTRYCRKIREEANNTLVCTFGEIRRLNVQRNHPLAKTDTRCQLQNALRVTQQEVD